MQLIVIFNTKGYEREVSLLTLICLNLGYIAEQHRGRRYLLSQLIQSSFGSINSRKRNVKNHKYSGQGGAGIGSGSLALGYEVLEVKEDGDEGISSFYVSSYYLVSSLDHGATTMCRRQKKDRMKRRNFEF